MKLHNTKNPFRETNKIESNLYSYYNIMHLGNPSKYDVCLSSQLVLLPRQHLANILGFVSKYIQRFILTVNGGATVFVTNPYSMEHF